MRLCSFIHLVVVCSKVQDIWHSTGKISIDISPLAQWWKHRYNIIHLINRYNMSCSKRSLRPAQATVTQRGGLLKQQISWICQKHVAFRQILDYCSFEMCLHILSQPNTTVNILDGTCFCIYSYYCWCCCRCCSTINTPASNGYGFALAQTGGIWCVRILKLNNSGNVLPGGAFKRTIWSALKPEGAFFSSSLSSKHGCFCVLSICCHAPLAVRKATKNIPTGGNLIGFPPWVLSHLIQCCTSHPRYACVVKGLWFALSVLGIIQWQNKRG